MGTRYLAWSCGVYSESCRVEVDVGRIRLLFSLLGLLSLPAAAPAGELQFDVDVRYLYGDWRWGDAKMRTEAGVAGPEARLVFADLWSARLSYLTGDFAAVGAVPLADPVYHSRRNYDLSDRRETFDAALEFRPIKSLGIALVYRFARYEHDAVIQLDSDQRLYGEGVESTIAELSAWGLAARSELPLVHGLRLLSEAAWYPYARTEASGHYEFNMLFRPDSLDERWYGRFEPTGLRATVEIRHELSSLPATISAGWLHERFDDAAAKQSDWLSDYLVGGGRDWRKDYLQGVTLRAGFHF
jgi:hypothetical protein